MRSMFITLGALVSAAGLVLNSLPSVAQQASPGATIQIITPLYAYGPPSEDIQRFRPRYDRGRYAERRSYLPRPYDGSQYGQPYARYDVRRTPRSAYRRLTPYRYPAQQYARGSAENRFAARIITPQWNGQWRSVSPIGKAQPY